MTNEHSQAEPAEECPGEPSVSAAAVERLLGPLSWARFRDTWWEREPLHVERADPAHFSDLLSVTAIESLLSRRDLEFPQVQLTDAMQPVRVEEYSDEGGRIRPDALVRRHHAGASIILSQAHQLFNPLQHFCNRLHGDLGMRCQANAYLSPPGKPGFKPHYDAHDVFVLQIQGSKAFHFYGGGVELPMPDDRFDAAVSAPGAPGDVIHLSAGDTLYIPRGVMHDAVAESDDRSLHVTIGVFPLLVHQLLQELIQLGAETRRELRVSVPMHELDGHTNQITWLTDVKALIDGAFREPFLDQALSRWRDREALAIARERPSTLDLQSARPVIELASTLAIVPGVLLGSRQTSQDLVLRLPGRLLELIEPMSSVLVPLLTDGKVRVSELPGLSDAQKLALAAQLLDEGVVDTRSGPC